MIPFNAFEPLTAALKNALSKAGIAITPGGELDRLCDLTIRLARGELSQTERQRADALESIAGFVTFARKIARISFHNDFPELTDHLRRLESGKIKLNTPDTDPKTEGPKLFELLIALSVFPIGSNIKLDDPAGGSQGTNPDVLADVGHQRWAFACKLLYGQMGLTVKRATEKGIDQIERSPATKGVVVISINNLLDHAAIRGDITRGWGSIDEPLQLMRDTVERKREQLKGEFSEADLKALFVGKKAEPVILLYSHALAIVRSAVDDRPIPALIRFLSSMTFGDVSTASTTLNRLNLALQDQPDIAQT